MELWFTMKYYVTMKKLWYYGQNYGNTLRTMELWFTKKNHGRLPKIYNGKNYGKIPK